MTNEFTPPPPSETPTDTRLRSDQLRELNLKVMEAKQALNEAQRAFGPEPVEDFTLTNPDGSAVNLSELFGDSPDLLVAHNMGRGCNYCTLWADGFVGYTNHLAQRCPFVLCSNDPPAKLAAAIAERGWDYRCVSGIGPADANGNASNSGFANAMGFMGKDGQPWPGISGFHKDADGHITRTGSAPFGPGDDFCPVWPMFELLNDGVGGFEPE